MSDAAPRYRSTQPAATSAGPEVVELAKSAGLILDGWQSDVLIDALGEDADGKWVAPEVGLVVPRQNGKGSILEARQLGGLYLLDEELQVHTTHNFSTTKEHYFRLRSLIEGAPHLREEVKAFRVANDDMAIVMRSGRRLKFLARTGGGGRGFSGDTVYLDEAFALTDGQIAALFPTMSARPNWQVWYTSSAPLEESLVLRRVMGRGRAGSPGLAFTEFCCDPHAFSDDESAWAEAHPALGIRITAASIVAERGVMDDPTFRRERLGDVQLEDTEPAGVIPKRQWARCATLSYTPGETLRYAIDVDVNVRGEEWCSVAVCDGTHVEVVTPPEVGSGTDWLLPAMIAKRDAGVEFGEIVIDPMGPAGKLIDMLEMAEFEVRRVKAGEFTAGSQQFFDAVIEGKVVHIGQPQLDRAAAKAMRRDVGDGAWRFSRKLSAEDISSLVAVMLARWVFMADEPSVYNERDLVSF